MQVQVNGTTLQVASADQARRAAARWLANAEEWEPGSAERLHCLAVAEAMTKAATQMERAN